MFKMTDKMSRDIVKFRELAVWRIVNHMEEPTRFPSQFKFDGKFVSLYFHSIPGYDMATQSRHDIYLSVLHDAGF